MKIKSEIIYTDTIYYYKKPVHGYICSILSANDPDVKNLNILERDSELELEYILEPNTTMSDIRNAICEKMNKQIGDLCRSCPCICIKSHEDFIEIENMDIIVETLLRKFQIDGNLQLYFAFSALQGDIWREGQIHYYMQSREYGKHNRPHVHVNAGDRYSAAIDILTGEILAGEIPGKYMKQIKNKVEKNRGFLIDCWNNMTDGINVDIDYRFGITSFRNVLTDYEGVKERN